MPPKKQKKPKNQQQKKNPPQILYNVILYLENRTPFS